MIQQGHMPHTIGRRLRRGGHLPLCDFRAAFPHLSPLRLFNATLACEGTAPSLPQNIETWKHQTHHSTTR